MFIGTINKLDVNRTVLVETHYLDRFDPTYISNDCFSIIVIKNGSLTARIKNPLRYYLTVAQMLESLNLTHSF